MNRQQELFLIQARVSYRLFIRLKTEWDKSATKEESGILPCCLLYQIQIATENLAKAYLWRSGNPGKKHEVVQIFMRAIRSNDRLRRNLGYTDRKQWREEITRLVRLALHIEALTPALAEKQTIRNRGQNHEYPWPADLPTQAPANYRFPIWDTICKTEMGNQWLQFLKGLFNHAEHCF